MSTALLIILGAVVVSIAILGVLGSVPAVHRQRRGTPSGSRHDGQFFGGFTDGGGGGGGSDGGGSGGCDSGGGGGSC
jgi:hypothetical protein